MGVSQWKARDTSTRSSGRRQTIRPNYLGKIKKHSLRSWREDLKLRDLRALRGDKLFDHEGHEAHEGGEPKTYFMDNHHGHDHEGSAEPHTHLVSVGIDIGSSTSHLMFSQLAIGYPSAHRRRPEILERKIIARSPVLLTPFKANWNIEAGPLERLIDESFRSAGLSRENIDTGAVIITGEAARRENAQKIAELFSAQVGRFVCATAGPRLEALLAAHGSGE